MGSYSTLLPAILGYRQDNCLKARQMHLSAFWKLGGFREGCLNSHLRVLNYARKKSRSSLRPQMKNQIPGIIRGLN
jgi:hypothetical protein